LEATPPTTTILEIFSLLPALRVFSVRTSQIASSKLAHTSSILYWGFVFK